MRRTLSITSATSADTTVASSPAAGIIEAAIVRRLRIHAVYNKTDMILAPHILYTRHDDPFLDAVVLERDGKPPKEIKLASFKLAGLTGLTLTTERFDQHNIFNPAEPRYVDCTIAQIKPVVARIVEG